MPHGKYGYLPRDLSLAAPILEDYLYNANQLPKAPVTTDWMTRVPSWPMYLNNDVGDCTCAGMLHSLGAMSYYATGKEALFTDSSCLEMYSSVSGYDPETGANDNGATLAQVCQYMTKTGVKDTNGKLHKLAAWAEIEQFDDLDYLKQVLYGFGSVYLGVRLPKSAEQQFDEGEPWAPVFGSPIAGGHCVVLQYSTAIGFDDETVITWGAEQKVNRPFLRKYLVQAVALVSEDWVAVNGESPSGLNLSQLIADSKLV